MKNWLITGVSRGLGKALAEAALARGDTVIGTVRDSAPQIATGRGQFHCLRLEIRDPAAIEATVARAFDLAGRLDVVVNNAGYGLLGAIENASDAEMAHLFDVNVFGPVRLIRAVLPRLRAQRAGHIINITSIAGRAPMAAQVFTPLPSSPSKGCRRRWHRKRAPRHQGDGGRAGRIPD